MQGIHKHTDILCKYLVDSEYTGNTQDSNILQDFFLVQFNGEPVNHTSVLLLPVTVMPVTAEFEMGCINKKISHEYLG